jgi:hypothetical protein
MKTVVSIVLVIGIGVCMAGAVMLAAIYYVLVGDNEQHPE